MGISFGTTKVYDAFKYSSWWNLGQFKSACAIHCSQKQRRTAKSLWVVTDQTRWRLLSSAEDCWADGRVTPGARQCGEAALLLQVQPYNWTERSLQSAVWQHWLHNPLILVLLARPTLSEISHYIGCPYSSLPQKRGSWLCKHNHCILLHKNGTCISGTGHYK